MMQSTLNFIRTGKGPALVLVHGFLLGGEFWRPIINLLQDRFDIIAPDLPGFAGSGHLPPADSVEGMADNVVELLNDLGVDRFSLMGHSMGGTVAQQIALEQDTRVDKLIVYASASGLNSLSSKSPPPGRGPKERQAVLAKEGVDGFRRWMAPYWFAAGEDSPFIEECLASGVGCSLEAAQSGSKYMTSWDRTDDLNQISMPTLVIGGDRDRTFSVEAMTCVARHVQQGQLCILPGAAHCPHLETADLFNQALSDFLA